MPPRRLSTSGAAAPEGGSDAQNGDAGPSSTARQRALRTRDAPAPALRSKGKARVISKDEMQRIHAKLGPEGTAARRDELVREREVELRVVMEEHDMAVKEKFHLERYVSILEGWDPAEARVDNSPVFMDVRATLEAADG